MAATRARRTAIAPVSARPRVAAKVSAPRAARATISDRAPRRTQRERREGTIRLLLDAATETLIAIGYASASVQRVALRAGVSQGALFGHFPTREALMVAVGDDVGKKLLARYQREFVKVAGKGTPVERVLAATRLLRAACRSELNQAWYELRVAARTSPALKQALRPVIERYYDDIERLARGVLPELADALGDTFVVMVDTMIAVFDGETLHRFVKENPRVEEARMKLLAEFAGSVLARE